MFSHEQAAAYLAAMIDGEGWIGDPKHLTNRAIRISNTDTDLIEAIKETCECLGISYTVQFIPSRKEGWAPGWWVDITGRENMLRIRDVVPIRCTRKRERLDRTIESYRVPLDATEVRRLYEDEGLTRKEIAARLGVGHKRVLNIMRAAGITSRSHAERLDSIWRIRRSRYGATGRPQ